MIPADENNSSGVTPWDGRTERRHSIMDQAALYKEVGELTGLVKAVLGKVEELKVSTDAQMKEVYTELEQVRREMQEDKLLRREDQETMDKKIQREIGRLEERMLNMRVERIERDQAQDERIKALETWQKAHDNAIEDAKRARENSLGVRIRNQVITVSVGIFTVGFIGWVFWNFVTYMASVGKLPTP